MCIRDRFDALKNSLCGIDERFNTIKIQMQDDVDNIREREESTRNTGKCSENIINKITENKVSNKVNSDEVNQVFEKAVSKNDTVNSDNENRMRVEVNYGVLLSVYELEREYKDSLNEQCEQRAEFIICIKLNCNKTLILCSY